MRIPDKKEFVRASRGEAMEVSRGERRRRGEVAVEALLRFLAKDVTVQVMPM